MPMDFQYDETYFDDHYSSPLYRWYIRIRNRFIKRELTQHVTGGTLLEIGFGDDNLLKFFDGDFDVFGLDVSAFAVDQITDRYPEEHFAVGDIAAEPIPFERSFDVICAINTIEHLTAPKAGLIHMVEALKPAGIAVLYLPTRSNSLSALQYKFLYDVEEHVYRPSVPVLQNMLRGLGLRALDEYAASFIPVKLSSQLMLESFNLYCGFWQKS